MEASNVLSEADPVAQVRERVAEVIELADDDALVLNSDIGRMPE